MTVWHSAFSGHRHGTRSLVGMVVDIERAGDNSSTDTAPLTTSRPEVVIRANLQEVLLAPRGAISQAEDQQTHHEGPPRAEVLLHPQVHKAITAPRVTVVAAAVVVVGTAKAEEVLLTMQRAATVEGVAMEPGAHRHPGDTAQRQRRRLEVMVPHMETRTVEAQLQGRRGRTHHHLPVLLRSTPEEAVPMAAVAVAVVHLVRMVVVKEVVDTDGRFWPEAFSLGSLHAQGECM